MKSQETKKQIKLRNLFLVLQLLLMLGTVVFLIIATIAGLDISSTMTFKEQYGTVLTSLGISLGITSFMLLVIGHKVRNTLWMGCVLLSSYLYGTTGMWVIFALWCLDEYIVYPIYKHKQAQVITNKEIDKRC